MTRTVIQLQLLYFPSLMTALRTWNFRGPLQKQLLATVLPILKDAL